MGAGTLAEVNSVSHSKNGLSASGHDASTSHARFDADWHNISSGLRRDLGAQVYGQWIRSISLGDYCDLTGTLELLLPSDFSVMRCGIYGTWLLRRGTFHGGTPVLVCT